MLPQSFWCYSDFRVFDETDGLRSGNTITVAAQGEAGTTDEVTAEDVIALAALTDGDITLSDGGDGTISRIQMM